VQQLSLCFLSWEDEDVVADRRRVLWTAVERRWTVRDGERSAEVGTVRRPTEDGIHGEGRTTAAGDDGGRRRTFDSGLVFEGLNYEGFYVNFTLNTSVTIKTGWRKYYFIS
jgi:hypothetical protein